MFCGSSFFILRELTARLLLGDYVPLHKIRGGGGGGYKENNLGSGLGRSETICHKETVGVRITLRGLGVSPKPKTLNPINLFTDADKESLVPLQPFSTAHISLDLYVYTIYDYICLGVPSATPICSKQ